MDVTKPYEFIGFGAMDVTKPHEFIVFGAMDVTKPHEFRGFGAMDVTKPHEFIWFWAINCRPVCLQFIRPAGQISSTTGQNRPRTGQAWPKTDQQLTNIFLKPHKNKNISFRTEISILGADIVSRS